MDSRKQYSNASKESCSKHTSSADRLNTCINTLPCLVRRYVWVPKGQTRSTTSVADALATILNRYARLSCARSALPTWHVLPRGALASSRYSHVRRIECHVVLRVPDYLFFALFPPPERASSHLFICARAQKPERFFHMNCTSWNHMSHFMLYIIQVSSLCGDVAPCWARMFT